MEKILTYSSHQKGFSLLEMAVVVMIAGFIFVPLMIVLVQMGQDEKRAANIANSDRVLMAVYAYAQKNGGKFPCPATATLPITSDDFGVAASSCSTGSGDVAHGALPVVTLGLPYHHSVNQYGWQHIYAVTKALTTSPNADPKVQVNIAKQSGNAQMVPFIVVNVGKDGKGSRSIHGIANVQTCTGDAQDVENCDKNNAVFNDSVFANTGSSNHEYYFDDKLSYGAMSKGNGVWNEINASSAGNRKFLTNGTMGNVGVGGSVPTGDESEDESDDESDDTSNNIIFAVVDGGVILDGSNADLAVEGNVDLEGDVEVTSTIEASTSVTAKSFSF